MSEEVIINLCKELSSNKSSFGAIYKCFDNNKDNEDLLTKAANYEDEFNLPPLHYLVMEKPPSDLVKRLLQLAPDAVKVPDIKGGLPLNVAVGWNASSDIIKILLEAYPEAAKVPDKDDRLPLHIALFFEAFFEASSDIIKMLLEACPEAA
jgi:hypothetical protein